MYLIKYILLLSSVPRLSSRWRQKRERERECVCVCVCVCVRPVSLRPGLSAPSRLTAATLRRLLSAPPPPLLGSRTRSCSVPPSAASCVRVCACVYVCARAVWWLTYGLTEGGFCCQPGGLFCWSGTFTGACPEEPEPRSCTDSAEVQPTDTVTTRILLFISSWFRLLFVILIRIKSSRVTLRHRLASRRHGSSCGRLRVRLPAE